MNSETLSLKTIISKLDLLKKAVIIPWNVKKKIEIFVLLGTKLIEKVADPVMLRNVVILI